MTNWIGVAIPLVLFGTFCTAIGYTLQKLEHKRNPNSNETYKKIKWWLGCLFLLIGAIISVVALGMVPQTTLSPASSVTLLYNSFLAAKVLKERFTRIDLISTCFIVVGTIITVVFSEKHNSQYTVPILFDLYFRPASIIYVCVYVGSMFLLYFLSVKALREFKLAYMSEQNVGDSRKAKVILDPENQEPETKQSKKEQALALKEEERKKIKGFLVYKGVDICRARGERPLGKYFPNALAGRLPMIMFPWMAGTFSGFTSLFLKSFVELIKTEGDYPNFKTAMPYVVLFIGLTCLLGLMSLLNRGLKYYDSLEVVPIYQSSLFLNNLLCGGIILGEFRFFHAKNYALFFTGSFLILIGILSLMFKKKRTETEEQQELAYTRTAISKSKYSKSENIAGRSRDSRKLAVRGEEIIIEVHSMVI